MYCVCGSFTVLCCLSFSQLSVCIYKSDSSVVIDTNDAYLHHRLMPKERGTLWPYVQNVKLPLWLLMFTTVGFYANHLFGTSPCWLKLKEVWEDNRLQFWKVPQIYHKYLIFFIYQCQYKIGICTWVPHSSTIHQLLQSSYKIPLHLVRMRAIIFGMFTIHQNKLNYSYRCIIFTLA